MVKQSIVKQPLVCQQPNAYHRSYDKTKIPNPTTKTQLPPSSAIPHLALSATQRIPNPKNPNQNPLFSSIATKPPKLPIDVVSTLPPSSMESTPSTPSRSPSPQHQFAPTQPFADRILRALHHRLRLLHRSDDAFFVLGQTGNVYTVTLSSAPSCTCPDRTTPCKHILFVFLRVLRLSVDDPCLRRRTLRPCHLTRLLGSPVYPDTLAGPRAIERFHQLLNSRGSAAEPACKVEDGDACPVCMEEMKGEERLVACSVCGNSLHEECFMAWKRNRGRRAASCVVCRAKWRGRKEQEAYMNLAAYVSEEDDVAAEDRRRSCRAT